MGMIASSSYTLSKHIFDFFDAFTYVLKRKKKKDYCHPKKITRDDRHLFFFGGAYQRFSSLKVPSNEHAQPKCPSAHCPQFFR